MTIPKVDRAGLSAALGEGPVVALLTSPTCGHCKSAKTALDTLAQEYAGRAACVQIDIHEQPDVVKILAPGIQSVPRHVFLDDRRVVGALDGARPLPDVRQWIDRCLAGG